MRVNKVDIDSIILGKTFLEIINFSDEVDFLQFEDKYKEEFNPFYVMCKIPIENINSIHALEKNGFNFIEFQIREVLKLKNRFNPISFEPYRLEPVLTHEDLNQVLTIASETFKHDRFTAEPLIPKSFSGERYKRYVLKSFETKNEYVYKLVNSTTGEILAFKTHKIINENEALMYLGGVPDKYKKSPIPVISGCLELNGLMDKGVKKVTTHISGSNYGVLNLEINQFGYKVVNAFAVLRKIYYTG
jgi:hypothetical protein